mgnify:FL=1
MLRFLTKLRLLKFNNLSKIFYKTIKACKKAFFNVGILSFVGNYIVMIKKYLLLCIFILILIYSIFSNFFVSKRIDDKKIKVKVNDQEYSVDVGTTYKELKEEYDLDASSNVADEAILYENQEVDINDNAGKISINKATYEELITLPGIGPKTAEKIIEYRNTYGSFWSLEDIKKVKGIGDKKYAKLKEYITI